MVSSAEFFLEAGMNVALLDRNGNARKGSGIRVTVFFQEGGSASGTTNGQGVAFIDISERRVKNVQVGGSDVRSFTPGSFDRHDTLEAVVE